MSGLNHKSSVHSDVEKRLTAIWASILGRQVTIDDDFLEVGGDSLSAMLCIARVRAEFGVDLEIEDFFVQPATVASLSVLVDQMLSGSMNALGG